MAQASGITLPGQPPLLHFSRGVDVRVWLPERLRISDAREPAAHRDRGFRAAYGPMRRSR